MSLKDKAEQVKNKAEQMKTKIAEKRAEKEKEQAMSYKIMTEEDGRIKTINHPVSSFGGGTFFEYYSGGDNIKP